jgi:hypothetical protein
MATMMIAKTSFIQKKIDTNLMLKNEAIDRLASVVDDLPKYKKQLEELIVKFTVDDVIQMINTIYRDQDFKSSAYYRLYNEYFDEIEDLMYNLKN